MGTEWVIDGHVRSVLVWWMKRWTEKACWDDLQDSVSECLGEFSSFQSHFGLKSASVRDGSAATLEDTTSFGSE